MEEAPASLPPELEAVEDTVLVEDTVEDMEEDLEEDMVEDSALDSEGMVTTSS